MTRKIDDQLAERIMAEGGLVWARYNAMITAHALVVGFVAVVLTAHDGPLAQAAAVFGFFLCAFWFGLTKTGWDLQTRLLQDARTQDPNGAYRHGSEWIKRWAYLVILLFALAYIALFLAASRDP